MGFLLWIFAVALDFYVLILLIIDRLVRGILPINVALAVRSGGYSTFNCPVTAFCATLGRHPPS